MARSAIVEVRPLTFQLIDDGLIPNNPALPFVVYRGAIDFAGSRDPAGVIERAFAANGWGDMWRNGIYPFPHYHSQIHEALGIACGRARVRFGGGAGQDLDVEAGDVAVLPAGTGHQRLAATPDLLVVGAYPPAGAYDLCRATPDHHAKALRSIPQVPLPQSDPLYGPDGALMSLWRRAASSAAAKSA